MSLYDALMKGPPRWVRTMVLLLFVALVCSQIGIHRGRAMATEEQIGGVLLAKDQDINDLKAWANVLARELQLEKDKLEILTCESGIRHDNIWGDGGKSYGIAQFQYATFKDLREKAGRPDLRWKNRADQIWLLDWALRNGYGKYWTCYKKTGSGGQGPGAPKEKKEKRT